MFGKWDDDWKTDFQEICGLLSVRDNVLSIPVEEEQSVRLRNQLLASFPRLVFQMDLGMRLNQS